MNKDQREIQRKLRILQHAEKTGTSPRLVDILGLADPVSIVGVRLIQIVVKLG